MNICLLGASGSIGSQTLDVIKQNPKDFTLVSFSVGKQTDKIDQILKDNPKVSDVYLKDASLVEEFHKKYPSVNFVSGEENLSSLITLSKCEMVVNALVGYVGLLPSVTAIKNHKLLALANKESLVIGGELINKLLKEYNGTLYPIDSEHSAIWKCLKVDDKNVDKLYITASGGAFRNLKRDQLVNVTKNDALKHPTWNMGNKITIDCASMMNKGFEIMEAYYLFGYKYEQVEVVLHDESMLHSAVKYKDGLIRGEINKPDMRNPIKFALYQGNIPFDTTVFTKFDDLKDLHFHKFDINRYPLVGLAKEVIDKGGNVGAIINAANEVANRAFLEDKISFLRLEEVIFETLKRAKYISSPSLEELKLSHEQATKIALDLIKEGNR
ncbi:MAG: 1-deoxy-D-xylulose-5-phosphate reductoisomerase [Bacilli bacterium]|nr:1-deoxy-D-xylulose-5-phosphate reductoisomerase [Bacilli bacterium]